MELEDFSDLRDLRDGPIRIPLNGVVYMADPHPPADVPLAATTGADVHAMELMARATEGETLTGAEQARAATVGQSSLTKAVVFLQDVLEPESLERWRFHMAKAPADASTKVRNEHAKHRITLRQVVAVYRALIAAYSGGRPTTPASSSGNGHGDAGTTSTPGASPSAEG